MGHSTSTPSLGSIETALESAIVAGRKAYTGPRESFWASSLGMCPRRQVAERAGLAPTNPPDRRSQIKMWLGTVYGRAIQEALEASGFLDPAWREKAVQYRSYHGKMDGYTAQIQEGAIVEIKTADDDASTRYPDMPAHYKLQGMLYCVATGVPNLLVFQVGKSQGLVRHRVYRCEEQWQREIESRVAFVDYHWEVYGKSGKLPDHFHEFKWEDRLCPYLEDEGSDITGKVARV